MKINQLQRQVDEIQAEVDDMLGVHHPTESCPECKGDRSVVREGKEVACPTCIGRGKISLNEQNQGENQ